MKRRSFVLFLTVNLLWDWLAGGQSRMRTFANWLCIAVMANIEMYFKNKGNGGKKRGKERYRENKKVRRTLNEGDSVLSAGKFLING
jgi:hypothetical protein